jgi:hypothetical protein
LAFGGGLRIEGQLSSAASYSHCRPIPAVRERRLRGRESRTEGELMIEKGTAGGRRLGPGEGHDPVSQERWRSPSGRTSTWRAIGHHRRRDPSAGPAGAALSAHVAAGKGSTLEPVVVSGSLASEPATSACHTGAIHLFSCVETGSRTHTPCYWATEGRGM